jgi:hypothetical protein
MSDYKKKRGKSPITVRGVWFPMPTDFLKSRACAELSPHAIKLLMDLCAQLGPNARRNGDLSAAPTVLAPRGWSSKATLASALQELQSARLVITTRQGGRNRCSLYAVTLWPMDCDFGKLDHGPGCYAMTDWHDDPSRATAPDFTKPAQWGKTRRREIASPATGEQAARLPPSRGKGNGSCPTNCPRHGGSQPLLDQAPSPATGYLSRLPSPTASGAAVDALGTKHVSDDGASDALALAEPGMKSLLEQLQRRTRARL